MPSSDSRLGGLDEEARGQDREPAPGAEKMYPSISLADAFGSAELLLRIDELDLACTTLDAIAVVGRATRLTSCEAAAELRDGKPERARAPLEQLHVNRPDDQEWAILLVECLRRLGEEDEARELLAPLLERVPIAAPAALLAAVLAKDEASAEDFLRE